jgi:hypothetical protein
MQLILKAFCDRRIYGTDHRGAENNIADRLGSPSTDGVGLSIFCFFDCFINNIH